MRKRTKDFLFSIIFLVVLGLGSYSFRLLGGPTFKTLYEQNFDKKIDEVVFDSYRENGNIIYYPKIIVFKESDDFTIKREYKHERFDDERVFKNVNKEIKVFSSKGKQIKSISGDKYNFYAGGEIHISESANYIAIMQVVRMEDFYSTLMNLYFSREDIDSMRRVEEIGRDKLEDIILKKYEGEYGKLIEPSFSLYNDKGELLWKKEKLWESHYMPEDFYIKKICPNGNILGIWLGKWWIINTSGNKRMVFPPELHQCLTKHLDLARDCNYIAVAFKEEATHFYKNLPGKSSKPGVALLDSNWNLLWKKSLENYLISAAIISPYGSYIAAQTYTMAGVMYDKESGKKLRGPGEGLAAKTGYLFNREGKLIMNPPLGTGLWRNELSLFSENERFFAARDDRRLSFIDIEEKKIIYEKDFPSRILGISVSNYGKCAVVTRRQENLEYYSTGRPSKMRYLYKGFIVDEKGNTVWDSGEMEATSTDLLGWDKNNCFFAIMDKEKEYIKIVKVSL